MRRRRVHTARPIDPGLIPTVARQIQLVWRLMRDERVPAALKVIVPLVTLLYLVLPVDLVPDVIPVLGQVDDLGLLWLSLVLFVRLAPGAVVAEHRRSMAGAGPTAGLDDDGEVIEAEFRPAGPSAGPAGH